MTSLKVGHTLVSGKIKTIHTQRNVSRVQPAWPVILPSLAAVDKYQCDISPQILFVCDALALLSNCNLRIIRMEGLEQNIKDALAYATANPEQNSWKLQKVEPTIADYVNHATKPSFLNNLQTAIYKIAPYDLKKKIQTSIIGYLAGTVSKTSLMAQLNANLKLDTLRRLMLDPKATELKDAVAMYAKTKSIEVVTATTGFESFEILYIYRSSEKTVAEAKKNR
jgi:hypothetical protein